MPDIVIEGLPESVIARLRERAEKHGRTLSEELKRVVLDSTPPRTIAELRREVAELGIAGPSEAAAIVRDMRDSR